MTTHRRARWMLLVVLGALIVVGTLLGPVVWEKVWYRWEAEWDWPGRELWVLRKALEITRRRVEQAA